ncbi:MlaC/ttg2D family ABC transporter substrate-binding protein [Kordiimonas marina]|uniref:MlaC/ttg2D family ABC transporter substrate-binding protein n=1 Tax=Kordiimonas marina TaxID=2872312 RepID=UPI001FF34D45|nr:ABC transporter substrate-binding protein [Kordiimonas marina]MCJ9430294.1 ABC transporter substrate-binding protein [Kordiimonas marina]
MKRLFALMILLFVPALPAAAQGQTAVDDPRGAIEFIQNLSKDVIAVWSDSKMNSKERYEAFRKLFENATDIDLLAKGMLGRHYRTATPAQRAAYMAAMTDYIVSEFDKRMTQIGFRSLEVTGTKPASGRHGHLFVRTQVARDQGEPILADWRVRKKDGKFQIVNLEFEGINLLITNRDVFSAKIKDVGFDGLVAWLKTQSTMTTGANVAHAS